MVIRRAFFAAALAWAAVVSGGCAAFLPEGWEMVDARSPYALHPVQASLPDVSAQPAALTTAVPDEAKLAPAADVALPQGVEGKLELPAETGPEKMPEQPPAAGSGDPWSSLSSTIAALREWKKLGFSREEAKNWRSCGFAPREAAQWKQAGFCPSQSVWWKKAGFTSVAARDRIDEVDSICQDFLLEMPGAKSNLYEIRGKCWDVVARTLTVMDSERR